MRHAEQTHSNMLHGGGQLLSLRPPDLGPVGPMQPDGTPHPAEQGNSDAMQDPDQETPWMTPEECHILFCGMLEGVPQESLAAAFLRDVLVDIYPGRYYPGPGAEATGSRPGADFIPPDADALGSPSGHAANPHRPGLNTANPDGHAAGQRQR